MNDHINDNVSHHTSHDRQPSETEKKELEERALKEQESKEEKSLEEQITDLKEQHLRDRADMENLRKRLSREMEKSRLFAIEDFARDLLPVLDNMRRALATLTEGATTSSGPAVSLKDGVRLTLRETEAMLARHHVRRIEAEGTLFDPNRHEALFEVPDSSFPPGTIVQIIEEGYMIGERLLRPARVGVAAAVQPSQEEEKIPETGENEQKDP